MKLEIKHLAPYLPNQPFIYFGALAGYEMIYPVLGYQPHKILTYEDGNRGNRIWVDLEQFQYHRLVLHPLSSLTKPITHKGDTFVPMHRLKNGGTDLNQFRYMEWKGYGAIDNEEHETTFDPITMSFYQFYRGESRMCTNQYEKFEKLFEWHFDVFGLIESGLAIDANTLTENPYAK